MRLFSFFHSSKSVFLFILGTINIHSPIRGEKEGITKIKMLLDGGGGTPSLGSPNFHFFSLAKIKEIAQFNKNIHVVSYQ